MDAQKVHLMLNHYPAIVMTGAAIIYAVGAWRGSERALRSAMYLMVTAAIITLPAFVTGEISGGIAATTHKGPQAEALAVHKNTARLAILLVCAAGFVAAIGLMIFRNGRNVGWLKTMLLILALAASGLIGYTTYLGRQVKWSSAQLNDRPMVLICRAGPTNIQVRRG